MNNNREIVSEMAKLYKIEHELVKLREQAAVLRKQISALTEEQASAKDNIQEYLEKYDQVGIKYEDMVIMAKTRKRRRRLNKEKRIENFNAVLGKFNVNEKYREKIAHELLEALKGEVYEQETISIKKK